MSKWLVLDSSGLHDPASGMPYGVLGADGKEYSYSGLGSVPLSSISPASRINEILAGMAAVRAAPALPGKLQRWCTVAGAGTRDGLSMATAWSKADVILALADLVLATSGTTAAGNATLNFASTTGCVLGASIKGVGVAPGAYVVSFTGTTVVMSVPSTAGVGSAANITFGEDMHIYMSGTFEPAAYNTAGPLFLHSASGTRLDFGTYGGVCRGFSGLSWTGPDGNGEYYATVSNQQGQFRIAEDGLAMKGVTGADCSAKSTVTAIDTSGDTITFDTYRPLAVNDVVAWISGAAYGLSPGTTYYVKTVNNVSTSTTVSLSLTPGGATVDITGVLAGTSYVWSLALGRYNDPVPGTLQPGQFSYAPHLARIYIKPSSGVVTDHTYTFWQTATNPHFVQIYKSGAVVSDASIVGLRAYCAPTYAIRLGGNVNGSALYPSVLGCEISAAESAISGTGSNYLTAKFNHVYDLSDHGIGGKGVTTAEVALLLQQNWVHDVSQHNWHSGDCEALVANPGSDDSIMDGNVCQRIGRVRDLVTYPFGTNDSNYNFGVLIIDSSKRCRLTRNYVEDSPGEQVEIGPNDYQACTDSVISGNIFDLRKNATYDVSAKVLTPPTCVSLRIESGAVTGYGSAYSNLFANNLILLGPCATPTSGSFDAGVFLLRNAKANGDTEARLTIRNNVILMTDPTAQWNIYAVRHSAASGGASGTVSGFNSDYNLICRAGNAASYGVRYSANVTSQAITSTVAIDNLTAGWTSPDGTISDRNSRVISLADFQATFLPNGVPVPAGIAYQVATATGVKEAVTWDGLRTTLKAVCGAFA